MVDDATRQNVMLMFRARDFESMWFSIKDIYDNLGFTDALTDQQRIDEYKWIVQQLRKYMFSKQDQVLSCDNVEGMINTIDSYIASAEEYGDERKKVVYNFMRDHWLYEVRNHLVGMLMDMELNVEEEDE